MNTVSERRYWAKRMGETLGPYGSMAEAIAAGRDQWSQDFMVGYGPEGPWFDIRFY